MKTIRTTLTLLLAVLWLPVSAHCLFLEVAPGFKSLSCCTHTETNIPATPHEDDCATDTCAAVEGAKYKSSSQRVTVPPLDLQVLFDLPPLLENDSFFPASPPHQFDDTLAWLPVAWQFSARTALLARAPSFVS
jgi:hypothetical protein